jgi:hypothetical protein
VDTWLRLPNQETGQEFVGLGWFCSGKEQTFRFCHDGWNHGYVATVLMLPAIGKGVVVMLKTANVSRPDQIPPREA